MEKQHAGETETWSCAPKSKRGCRNISASPRTGPASGSDYGSISVQRKLFSNMISSNWCWFAPERYPSDGNRENIRSAPARVSGDPGCAHGYRQMSEFEIINILYLPKRLKMELADLAKDAVCQAILGKTADSVLHDGFMLDADHMAMAGAILQGAGKRTAADPPRSPVCDAQRFPAPDAAAEPGPSPNPPESGTNSPGFNRILRYIAERDGEMLRPAEIASACNLSLRTLERVFIRHLGCSPGAYLIDRRLNRGAGLLAPTDRTITEIAYSCGFRESNYFCKLFRRKFFLSPQEYRRKFLPLQSSPRRGVDER